MQTILTKSQSAVKGKVNAYSLGINDYPNEAVVRVAAVLSALKCAILRHDERHAL
jgi:hypothetical protein